MIDTCACYSLCFRSFNDSCQAFGSRRGIPADFLISCHRVQDDNNYSYESKKLYLFSKAESKLS